MNRSDLTPNQLSVVESTDSRLLVLGGAGTGKTTTALWSAVEELRRPGNETKRALFLTFSRTAVDQIALRSGRLVESFGDRIEIATFHSFAYRLVRRFGLLTGTVDGRPVVQSASQTKLLGRADGQLTYDDLLPLACKVLDDPEVAALLAERWCIVICDEFQDTGNEQWAVLNRLSTRARTLLLGDEHQLIYDFLASSGVTVKRLENARRWVDRVVELEPSSHRDPTGAIPAMATAVRLRRFNDPAVLDAISDGRLRIRTGVDGDGAVDAIRSALDDAWNRGARTFGVFAHGNASVADPSSQLTENGVDHYLVGLPEAEADSLAAMLVLVRYAYRDVEWGEVRSALATFLTACTRGGAPPLAVALVDGSALPPALEQRMTTLRERLGAAAAGTLLDLATCATSAWRQLGFLAGTAPWDRSAPSFLALARQAGSGPGAFSSLSSAVARVRSSALLSSQPRRLPPVQVMNLHQTKGREADSVIILCGDDDYYGRGGEPFTNASRLLYVVLTRARSEVTVILGDRPHPLVAPFASL